MKRKILFIILLPLILTGCLKKEEKKEETIKVNTNEDEIKDQEEEGCAGVRR